MDWVRMTGQVQVELEVEVTLMACMINCLSNLSGLCKDRDDAA